MKPPRPGFRPSWPAALKSLAFYSFLGMAVVVLAYRFFRGVLAP